MRILPLVDVTVTVFIVITTVYGSWAIFYESFRSILPFGLILYFALLLGVYLIRVPPPSQEAVNAALGKDIHRASDEHMGYFMRTVAHRGAGLDAPENTLKAFSMCADAACDFIELDIQLTKDDVCIVFHDSDLERMALVKQKIADLTWDELKNIDISVTHIYKDRFKGTNIPTFEQTVVQLLEAGQRMFIDVKDCNQKIVKAIVDMYQRYPELYSKAVVSSFYPQVVYWVRRTDPKIVGCLAWRSSPFAYELHTYPFGNELRLGQTWYKQIYLECIDIIHSWLFHRILYYILGLSVVLLHKDDVCGKTVLDWRYRGVRVVVWTVNSPVEKQFFAKFLRIPYLTDTLVGEGTTHSSLSLK